MCVQCTLQCSVRIVRQQLDNDAACVGGPTMYYMIYKASAHTHALFVLRSVYMLYVYPVRALRKQTRRRCPVEQLIFCSIRPRCVSHANARAIFSFSNSHTTLPAVKAAAAVHHLRCVRAQFAGKLTAQTKTLRTHISRVESLLLVCVVSICVFVCALH